MEDTKLIDVKSVYDELQGDTSSVVIDVRSPEEFNGGHIEKSTSLPLEQVESGIESVVPDVNTQIYVFCRSGGRSSMAQMILESKGYKNVKNIVGGILEWKDQGLPLA